jgi:hypothetical protein
MIQSKVSLLIEKLEQTSAKKSFLRTLVRRNLASYSLTNVFAGI